MSIAGSLPPPHPPTPSPKALNTGMRLVEERCEVLSIVWYGVSNYQPINRQPINYQPINYQPINYQPINYQPIN